MRLDLITIFPEYFAPLDLSLIGKARERGTVHSQVHDLREWTDDVHRTVDDSPYGGGPGMIMKPEPWGAALAAVSGMSAAEHRSGDRGPARPRVIIPTPAGRPFDQAYAHELAGESWLVFCCGRYEGIDARVADALGGRRDQPRRLRPRRW